MNRSRLLIILFLVACSNHSHKTDTATASDSGNTLAIDTIGVSKKTGSLDSVPPYINHPTGYKDISKFEDNAINGIRLNDCDTITKLFGENIKLLPDIDDLPSLQILNMNKSQMLTMYMWNGSARCDFSQYQVEYAPVKHKFIQRPFILNVESFISGRNITLGMTQKELKMKIGEPNETSSENGDSILSYQEYNNLYFGDYYFRKGKLIKFRFGNEYP
jgi:hypothetical protein